MKNINFLLLLLAVFAQSCDKDKTQLPTCENCNFTCLNSNETDVVTNACRENWDCTFKYMPTSEVDIAEFEGVGDGNKQVFQFMSSTEGAENIADDEFTHILVFELEEDRTSFAAEGEELESLQVHFRRICFCVETDFTAVTSGCLQGEKQSDGSWFVQGNLIILYAGGDFPFKFEAQFVN